MREIMFARDILGIVDFTLWEAYCYMLGFTHFDGDGGGKRIPIQLHMAAAARVVQRSGVIA